jgi:hypothetical protein
MSALSVYSNHAGTTAESFTIGKRGVQLLQGTSAPSGLSAPTGSLYLLRGSDGSNKVYQIDSNGNWTALLAPDDIIAGTGILVNQDSANGTVTVSQTVTKYKQTFSESDLVSGILTVNHNLNEDFPIVAIYNDSRNYVSPDSINSSNTNQIVIGLQSFENISGNWTITVVSE